MGRRKQRVRWTSVEDRFFGQENINNEDFGNIATGPQKVIMVVNDETALPQTEVDYEENQISGSGLSDTSNGSQRQYAPSTQYQQQQQQQQQQSYYRKAYYGPPRRYGPSWNNGPVAPRFERKAAAEGRGMYSHDCSESEENLPNGFTKIRSKNLDVLFRKDYYAQRSHLSPSQTSSTAVSSEHGDDEQTAEDMNVDDKLVAVKEQTPFEEEEEEQHHEQEQEAAATTENKAENGEDSERKESETERQTEGQTEEQHEQPKKSVINGHASPFYPSGYLSPSPPMYMPGAPSSRPNLFLYSPTSNTMIPCEEIVIPNPVVGPEGGAIYQGPSNIYLAFPCENSPGAMGQYPSYMGTSGLSPSPLVHYDQYGVPYTSYHQPATSSVASGSSPPSAEIEDPNSLAYTSETGTEPSSAESTTPHSPPDLSAYSPANWADANGYIHQNGYNHPHQGQWYPQPHHQHFYGPPQHKRHYYNNRQNNYHSYNNSYHRPSYMTDRSGPCMPSSGGDSLAEEEEELRAADNEVSQHQLKEENSISTENHVAECVSKDVSLQKEQQLKEQPQQPQRVFIPGLPERLAAAAAAANGKRLQKKRRKKKTASTSTATATASTSGQESKLSHSLSSKSDQSATLANTTSSSEEDICRAVEAEPEQPETEQPEPEQQPEPEVEQIEEVVKVQEPIVETVVEPEIEEVVEVEAATVPEQQPEPLPEIEQQPELVVPEVVVSTPEEEEISEESVVVVDAQEEAGASRSSVAKPRRKRGKRSGQQNSEKQQRSAQLRQAEQEQKVEEAPIVEQISPKVESPKSVTETKPVVKDDQQWESVPAELKTSPSVEQWETSTRTRRSRKGGRQPPQMSEFFDEEVPLAIEKEIPEVVEIAAVVEIASEKTPDVETEIAAEEDIEESGETERSSSAPERRSSSSAPSSRRSTLKKQNRKKRPSLDDGKSEKSSANTIRPVLIQDGIIDINAGAFLSARTLLRHPSDILDEQALMIKDIGHGMREGPINMGRFGIGKYTPPDRSDEILSSIVARQLKDEVPEVVESGSLQEIEDETETASSVITGNTCQDLDLD